MDITLINGGEGQRVVIMRWIIPDEKNAVEVRQAWETDAEAYACWIGLCTACKVFSLAHPEIRLECSIEDAGRETYHAAFVRGEAE